MSAKRIREACGDDHEAAYRLCLSIGESTRWMSRSRAMLLFEAGRTAREVYVELGVSLRTAQEYFKRWSESKTLRR